MRPVPSRWLDLVRMVLLAAAIGLVSAPASVAKGVPDVDTGPLGFGLIPILSTDRELAQSFTAGRTGFLDTVEVSTSQDFGFGGRFEVRLTGVDPSGAPNTTTLASSVIDVCGPQTATFSPAPAVTDGQRYAVVVRYTADSRLGNQGRWPPGSTMPEGGAAWSRFPGTSPDWESLGFGTPTAEPLSFATYVSATQPAAASRDATTTSLSATPNTARRQQPVELTATVADQANVGATPAGNLTFVVDGVPDAGGPLDGTGTRHAVVFFDTAGAHMVNALYCPAAATFVSNETDAVPITVTAEKWATSTSITIHPDPTVAWQPAEFRAAVANSQPSGPKPTGTVQFTESDGTPIGDPLPLDANGTTKLTAAAGAGAYTVKALYSGDDLHAASQAATAQHVKRQTTTTTVVSSTNPATVSQPFAVGAAVIADDPSQGIPSGTVQFSVDGTAAGPTVELDPDGIAFVEVTARQAGSAVISARYSGDQDYFASQGSLTQSAVGGAAAATLPPEPLTRAQLLASLGIPKRILVSRKGTFRLVTHDSQRVRRLTVRLFAARKVTAGRGTKTRAGRVLVGRGRLTTGVIKARLTKPGRRALARHGRLRVQIRLKAIDDTGRAISTNTTSTLRLAARRRRATQTREARPVTAGTAQPLVRWRHAPWNIDRLRP